MEKNFKEVGFWWNDKEIELVEIDGSVYALHGWNGEEYTECWRCTGESHMHTTEERYTIRPVHEEVEEDEFEIIAYEVK